MTLFDAHEKAGGLNEYGIAAYKTVDDFAQREVAWLCSVGGIDIKIGVTLGRDVTSMRCASNMTRCFWRLASPAYAHWNSKAKISPA